MSEAFPPPFQGALAPDPVTMRRHAEILRREENPKVSLRLIHDQDRTRDAIKLFGTIPELTDQIVKAQAEGYGVFIPVNEGGNRGADITKICASFIDLDGVPLDGIKWHRLPDFITRRDDTHGHAYWLSDDQPIEQFNKIQRRLAKHYASDPAVCDLSRVMRLAGSVHQKRDPIKIELIEGVTEGNPAFLIGGHSVAEVCTGLPELPAPKQRGASVAAGEPVSLEMILELLRAIPPDCSREQWLKVCGGLVAAPCSDPAFDGCALFVSWSRGDLHGIRATKFDGEDYCEAQFNRDVEKFNGR